MPINSKIQTSEFIPEILPIEMDAEKIKKIMDYAKVTKKWVLCFIIGTKPCINKFYGAITNCIANHIPCLIIDSNQHYDPLLTQGLHEFGYLKHKCVNLNLRGDLSQKSSEIFVKVKFLAQYLKKNWPEVTTVPVVNGDVIVAAMAPAAWMFTTGEKGINMEAGLRSMTPAIMREVKPREYTVNEANNFISEQWSGPWYKMTNEPYPEQFDTFVSSKSCEFNFAPLKINRIHLIDEGYEPYKIFTHGAVVSDAWVELERKKVEQSIFDVYPKLEQGQWIRVDVHRKENTTERRFKAIIGGVQQLVEKGHQVNLIGMNATEHAIKKYKLETVLEGLKEKPNFLYTPLWPEFKQVFDFYKSDHCLFPLTDSGGVQEDMNYIGKPCLTLRFTTDRPESVMQAKGNVLIPPMAADQVSSMVDNIINSPYTIKKMSNVKKIYGLNFGRQFSKTIKDLMHADCTPFKWAHEELKLWKDNDRTNF